MAESSEQSKTGVTQAAAILDTIKKAVESLKPTEADVGATEDKAGERPKPGSSTAPPFVPTGLNDMASAAVQRYRTTIRWMLGAFGAVGVAIFGSLPFTNVTEATGGDRIWILTGLAAAAVGIALAVYAVSMVSEPVDASLGELAAAIEPEQEPSASPISVRPFVLEAVFGLLFGAIVGAVVGVVQADDGITLRGIVDEVGIAWPWESRSVAWGGYFGTGERGIHGSGRRRS